MPGYWTYNSRPSPGNQPIVSLPAFWSKRPSGGQYGQNLTTYGQRDAPVTVLRPIIHHGGPEVSFGEVGALFAPLTDSGALGDYLASLFRTFDKSTIELCSLVPAALTVAL